MTAIRDEIAAWHVASQAEFNPILSVIRLDDANFLLTDSRQAGGPTFDFLDEPTAAVSSAGSSKRPRTKLHLLAEPAGSPASTINGLAWQRLTNLMEYFEATNKTLLAPRDQTRSFLSSGPDSAGQDALRLTSPPEHDVSPPRTSARRR